MKEFIICFREAGGYTPGMPPSGRIFSHYKAKTVKQAVKQFRKTHLDHEIIFVSVVIPKERYE